MPEFDGGMYIPVTMTIITLLLVGIVGFQVMEQQQDMIAETYCEAEYGEVPDHAELIDDGEGANCEYGPRTVYAPGIPLDLNGGEEVEYEPA